MKYKTYFLVFMCMLLSSISSVSAAIGGDGIFYLKTSDGHETYTVNGSVVFKLSTGTFPTNRDAGVTFIPANAGDYIHVKVEQIDLDGTINYLLLYHGYIQTGYSGASNGVGQTSYMPAGWFAKIGSSAVGNEYDSESADGQLTIGFHSSSSANGQTGYTITVTCMSPKEMEFVSANAFLDNASVNRGGRNQILLGANILMDGGIEPMTLNEITFNTSAFSSTQMENLRLYSSDNFTGANLLATLPTLGATISYNNDIILNDGDNKFYLVADIKPDASGAIPSATLSSVVIENTAQAISTATATPLAIANTVLMATEHLTYTISNNADFYDDGGISGKISANFDGKITFVPATAGKKIKIDFSKLEIFNNSSNGLNDIFKFYNGQTVDESELITTLLKYAGVVKSTAADGSLTVTFKSVVGTPANGWEAVVSEVSPTAMTIEEVDAFQTSAGYVQPSATNQEIIGFWVKTDGDLSAQRVKEVKIDLKNSETAIDKASIFYTANQNDFSTATLFGFTTDFSAQQVAITGEQTLPEGTSYFWVAYDISNSATAGTQIDAALVSVTMYDDAVYLPVNGNPNGHRVVKTSIELPNGDNGQVTLAQCTKFYDEGGASLDYRNVSTFPFDGKITFLPSAVGQAVKMEFIGSIDIPCNHYLYIYEGTEVDAEKLLKTVSCTTSPSSSSYPQPIISESADGALTVRFVAASAPSLSYAGWEADVCSYTKVPLYIDNVTTTQAGAADIMRGSSNSAVQQIKVVVKGDFDEIALNDFIFTNGITANAADITKASLFYAGTSTGVVLDNQVGASATTSPYAFTAADDVIINKEGTYYFYLAYDIKQDAVSGNIIGAALTSFSANNDLVSDITVGSVVSRAVKSGMKGTYIIGSSSEAHYATFAAAISAAQGGLEGDVIFKIEAGTYNENVSISAISTSASSSLTFTSLSGNNDDVIIRGSGYSTSDNGIFKVAQTSYVTLENVTLIPQSQSYSYNLYLTDQSRYFTLRNCILQANVITSGSYGGMKLVYVQGLNEEGKNCDYFTAENNTLIGGDVGFYMYGTGYVVLTKQRGGTFKNNTVTNQNSKAIYLCEEKDALVENNTITNTTSNYSGFYGIDVYRSTGSLIIKDNKINLAPAGGYTSGIYLRSFTTAGTAQNPKQIYNNSISITSASASSYGVQTSVSTNEIYSYINFYYNTINMLGANGTCFGTTSSAGNINNNIFQNNLLQNNTTSGNGRVYFFATAAQYQAFAFSNNAYYGNGDFTNTLATFADWTTASNEQNAFVEQADFIAPTDLHLLAQGTLNAALPIEFILKDADGNFRSLTTPTIGAYEYEPVVAVTPEIDDDYPKTGIITHNSIEFKTKWNQTGKLYGIIKKTSETAPTKTEILTATAVNLNSGTEHTSNFTSLDELTDYKAYFVFVSVFDIESDIVASDVATTLKQIFPLEVILAETWATISAGTEIELFPIVSGAVSPYSYQWKNKMNEVVSTDSVLTVSPTIAQQYKLIVISNDNQTKTNYTDVLVRGEGVIATFEDNYLDVESYWQGRVEADGDSRFFSGSYSFNNTYYPSWYYWGNFGYSNVTATEFNPNQMSEHQFRSVVGHGADQSDTYAVVYDMGLMGASPEIEVIHSADGATVAGVYLTNAAYTYSSIIDGDDYDAPFAQGDYYKVIFTADNGSSVDCYLADFRSTNAEEHFVLADWKWFDLSSLGNVKTMTVVADGSRTNIYGVTTPTYFCMDNLGASDIADGLKDNELKTDITVFPNPFVDYVIINASANGVATLYNISGTVIVSKNIVNGNVRLDTSALPQGVYLLKVGNRAVKIVK